MRLINILTTFTVIFTLVTPIPAQANQFIYPSTEKSERIESVYPIMRDNITIHLSMPLEARQTNPIAIDLRELTLNHSVIISDTGFIPKIVSPTMGDQVTWTNNGTQTYNLNMVTSEHVYQIYLPIVVKNLGSTGLEASSSSTSGEPAALLGNWQSPDIPPGGSYSHTFVTPGTFPYNCVQNSDIEGLIAVLEPPLSFEVTTAGGTFTTLLLTIIIPSGAVTETITLHYTPLPPLELPEVIRPILHFTLEAENGLGEPVTHFALPIIIIYHYSDAEMQGVVEDSLAMYWQDTTVGGFYPLSGELDTDANTITFSLDHLSSFMTLGRAEPPPGEVDSDNDGLYDS